MTGPRATLTAGKVGQGPLSRLISHTILFGGDEKFDCPHCHRQQVVKPVDASFGAGTVRVFQCLGCSQLQVNLTLVRANSGSAQRFPFKVYPRTQNRPPKVFNHLPDEVESAYHQAYALVPIHAGAAGAYGRRALEVILDGMGYGAPTLFKSIALARAEDDRDRRLPRRLLDRLNYIKEVGNFALHVRRDGELAIIEMSAVEVEACLTIIEDLMTFVFEEPGEEKIQATELNKQLVEANKPPMPVSDAAPLWSAAMAADAAALDGAAGDKAAD